MRAEHVAAIDAEARTWLRTPYHHLGRVKGVGVDCAQFPIAVYSGLGLIPRIDPTYLRQWALHRGEEQYLEWVLRVGAREISRDEVGPGDFGVWRFGRTFSHGAILLRPPLIVHSVIRIGVTLDDMEQNSELAPGRRPARFFTIWAD